MQQPKPTNTTGVPILLSVVDANGNYRQIGATTSNVYGCYSYTWTPDISGDYTVIAEFAGSESYYGSSTSAAFYASEPAPTAAPVQSPSQPPTDMYILGGVAAIIVAIAIVGVVLLMAIRKRLI